MALLSYAVVTVAELKTYLQLTVATHDDRLEQLANGVTELFEKTTGAYFVQRAVTNRLSGANIPGRQGGAKTLFVRPVPVVSVTSIVDDDGNTVAAADYTVESAQGMLIYDGTWPYPQGRWTLTYVAGHVADTASVPTDVKLLAFQTVSAWFGRSDPNVTSQRIGDLSLTYRSGGGGQLAEGVLPLTVRAGLSPYFAWNI